MILKIFVNNYRKGYLFERKTKLFLEEKGFLVIRSPASKSPYDLIAIKDNLKLFIQCKKTTKKYLYVYDLDSLIEISKRERGLPLLVYSFNRTPMYAMLIDEVSVKLKKDSNHKLLVEFLDLVV